MAKAAIGEAAPFDMAKAAIGEAAPFGGAPYTAARTALRAKAAIGHCRLRIRASICYLGGL